MTNQQALLEIHQYIDERRGNEPVPAIVHSWLRARMARGESITPDLLYAIAEKHWGWFGDEIGTPKALVSFIAQIARLQSAQSVLDPVCGLGLLLQDIAATTGAQIIHGIEINVECREVAQSVVGHNATILLGDALKSPVGLQAQYDLIVAHPPLGMKLHDAAMAPQIGESLRGEMEQALAVWICTRLSASGTAIVILSPTFLQSQDGLTAQEAILKCGCRIRALIHLSPGSLSHARTSAYLAIIEHGVQKDVFVGEYSSSPQHQQALIENYKQRRPGKQLALGRLCALAGFRGYGALDAKDRLTRMVRAKQWQRVAAKSVIIKAEPLSSSKNPTGQGANGLFIRLTGQPMALLDPTTLSQSGMRECLHLSIDPVIADARYMVHWFNDSPIGQLSVAGARGPGTKMRIHVPTLLEADFFLPPLIEQRKILQGIEHLNRLRAEATELESALWNNANEEHLIVEKIKSINQQDHYRDWIESLPFPLASILWRHHAGGVSARERFEVLLHFFEATAAFLATIHLSAFMLDDGIWRQTAPELKKALSKYHLSLDRATFGAWRSTLEFLSKRCRKMLESANEILAFREFYGAASDRHLAMICNPELLMVLQRANKIRNETTGHGGAMGGDAAERIHDELFGLVQKIRGIFGRSWLDYELIQPAECRTKSGVYHYKAKRLMGTRSAPFEVIECDSTQRLESDELYLFDANSRKGMQLRPFIRVMPSPEKKSNACFIFSRSEESGSHFVSYHFEEESCMTAKFPEVEETFRRMHVFDDQP